MKKYELPLSPSCINIDSQFTGNIIVEFSEKASDYKVSCLYDEDPFEKFDIKQVRDTLFINSGEGVSVLSNGDVIINGSCSSSVSNSSGSTFINSGNVGMFGSNMNIAGGSIVCGSMTINGVNIKGDISQMNISHCNKKAPDIYIVMPSLEALKAKGCDSFTIKSGNKSKMLRVRASGKNNISFEESFVERLVLRCSGVCSVDAKKLQCNEADIEASGVGNVFIKAPKERVDAEASGCSALHVFGTTPKSNLQQSGLGNIIVYE